MTASCACPSWDKRLCLDIRYPFGSDPDDECVCTCHDPPDDPFDADEGNQL
jgi:hypothetical protein